MLDNMYSETKLYSKFGICFVKILLPTKGSVINQKVAGESAAVAGMVDGGRVEKC